MSLTLIHKHIMMRNIRKYPRTYLVVLSALLIFSFTIKMSTESSTRVDTRYVDRKLIWSLRDISCYDMDNEDVLETADYRAFPSNSIYFHETTCKGALDSRQACSVESAARAHPHWNINLLFAAPVTKDSFNKSSALLELKNIKFFRIHPTKYAKGTPLERFFSEGALNSTRYRIIHASDVLRYLTLFKWGGLYLDLDVVVVRPLTALAKNWAARESPFSIAAGAMALSRDTVGRSIAMEALRDIKRNYRSDLWGHNGPGVVTRVLQKMCSTTDINRMTAATCRGFEVYGPELFYPIEWRRSKAYFDVGELPKTNAYVYHVWNHLTEHMRAVEGSLYKTLAKKYCPIVYRVYSYDFN